MRNLFPSVPDRLTWWLLAFLGAATLIMGVAQGFTLKAEPVVAALLLLPPLLAVAHFYTYWRPNPQFAISFMLIAFFVVEGLILAPLSYITASWGFPLVDDYFVAFDEALGFDWLAVHQYTATRPWFAAVNKFAYTTCGFVMFLGWAVLVYTRQYERLTALLLASVLSAAVVVVIAGLIPGEATFAHYGVTPDQYGHLGVVPGQVFVYDFYALRDGSLRLIDLSRTEGICTFPSFHAVVGVLTWWAFANTPWLRWPVVIFSAFVLFATLPVGGHYLADVVGGAVIALACIAFAARYRQRVGNSEATPAPVGAREGQDALAGSGA